MAEEMIKKHIEAMERGIASNLKVIESDNKNIASNVLAIESGNKNVASNKLNIQNSVKALTGNYTAIWVIIGGIMLNLVLSTITYVMFSSAHAAAVADRHRLMNDVEVIKMSNVDKTSFDSKINQIKAEMDKMNELSTLTAQRQTINEANIEINHIMLKKLVDVLPTTAPVNIPDQLPLPARETAATEPSTKP